MIRIAVAGAEGRMGRLITELVQKDPGTELAARITRPNSTQGGWAEVETPVDILIDFSHQDAVLSHLKLCCERNVPMVIGVTGLSTAQKETILKASKNLPILMSPNMSIGANIIFKLLALTGQLLREQIVQKQFNTTTENSEKSIDIAITEIHHRHKKDAPSGTAKYMGEIIQQQLERERGNEQIQFSSLRLGEVMGDHRALFALEGEQLEIIHKAEDRIIFAKGALAAAKWLHQKAKVPGLYSMQDALTV